MSDSEKSTAIDCKSEPGITIGLIEAVMSVAALVRLRTEGRSDLIPEVEDALVDLRQDADLTALLSPAGDEWDPELDFGGEERSRRQAELARSMIDPETGRFRKAEGRMKCFRSFILPLSQPWEYEQAGSKRKPVKASLRVVIWQSKKKYRKATGPHRSKLSKACCYTLNGEKPPPKGEFGPFLAEIHLRIGWTIASVVVHELVHAIGELPRKAGRPDDPGKRGEVAAYRLQRLTESMGRNLAAIGLDFSPAKVSPTWEKR